MHLNHEANFILTSLIRVLDQLTLDEYTKPVTILQNRSLSQHIRHILEFYQELVLGYIKGEIDYDSRRRSLKIETDIEFAKEFILLLQKELTPLSLDTMLHLRISSHIPEERTRISSSLFREISYCNEHAIHHMAILKICFLSQFPHIEVSEGFGVAYATQISENSLVRF